MTLSCVEGLWRLVLQRCNNFSLPSSSHSSCLKFVINSYFIGYVRSDIYEHLLQFSKVFHLAVDEKTGDHCIVLDDSLSTVDARSAAVDNVLRELRCNGQIHSLKGWRNEEYGVYLGERSELLMRIERSAASLLGVVRYGVHVNGYCVRPLDGQLYDLAVPSSSALNCRHPSKGRLNASCVYMWLGVRSSSKPTWPGMLDNMAAGGLTYGLDVLNCARKECQEEANVPEHLLSSLQEVSRLSFMFEDERGVSPQVDYCFDLELPCDFVPDAVDGEVERFQLVSIPEVKLLICEDRFKANSALVILDFLYRHRFIDPDSDPQHREIQQWMHINFPFN